MENSKKPQIRLVDVQFGHGKSFGTGDLQISPKNFDWYRGGEKIGDLIVFSEEALSSTDSYTEKHKIGFIIEAPSWNNKPYDFIKKPENYNKFDYILTYNNELINLNPDKFKFYAFGGCWIYPEEQIVYEKNKNTSIIASNKRITTGHILRHDIVQRFRDNINGFYGGGYQFVQNKLEALKDYRYSIVVEQDRCEALFSEKIIDCFMTGTIPIYWGCDSIGNFFNKKGVLSFSNMSELEDILKISNEQYYLDNIEVVKENFELAKEFIIPEDYMWNNYFKELLNK